MEATVTSLLEWSAVSLPLKGQTQSGDCYLVKLFHQEALVAVVDGIGHGEVAATAARLTAQLIESFAGELTLDALISECHERLRGTRGAVLGLALLNASNDTLTWAGVGSVHGLLLRRRQTNGLKRQEALLPAAGVVGHRLPRVPISTVPVAYGDLLVMATDGIRPGFEMDIRGGESTQQIAQKILNGYALETDDALVLVVRYLHERQSLHLP